MAKRVTCRGERISSALLLPQALRVMVVTTVSGFCVIILSVLGSMRYSQPPHNPFAAYSDVFPGQPQDALAAYGFLCSPQDYNYPSGSVETLCVLRPAEGIFSYIEATASKGIIHFLYFGIRGRAINVGELVVMLELSNIRQHGELFFEWRGHFSSAAIDNPSKHFSVLRRVKRVTLTDSG